MFTPKEKETLIKAARKFAYIALTVGFIYFIHFLASIYREHTFEEGSIVEDIQFSMLLISCIIFLANAIFKPNYRALMFWLSSLCALGYVRELDKYFDATLPIISWKFGFLFVIAALLYAYKHRQSLRQQLYDFFNSSAFDMMITAMIIILPIGQLIGHRPLVNNVLGPERLADIKQLFEECAEIIGYFFILLSAVETSFYFKKK